MDHPTIADHPPELVARIMEIILSSGLRSVHYTGGADEGLLRALIAQRPLLEVSAMDIPNRWGSVTRLYWDEYEGCGLEYPERPDWQEDVPFYGEGAPAHEVGIQDWPWYHPEQFWEIVAFKVRRPPLLVIHFGRADTVVVEEAFYWEDGERRLRQQIEKCMIDHPSYTWEEHDGLRIGRWKKGVVSAYDKS